MIMATMIRVHAPDCSCSHHRKVFTRSEHKHLFTDTNKMLATMVSWHRQQGENPCWLYSVKEVRPATFEEMRKA